MELYIPSLFIIIITGILVFLILPRLTVPVVSLMSMVLLVYVLRSHYQTFYDEYRYSTWQLQLKNYAPYVMMGVLILFLLTSSISIFENGRTPEVPVVPEAAPLPPASTATNPITSVINSGIRAVQNVGEAIANTGEQIVNTVSGATGATNANRRNNRSNYNLSALIKTPLTQ